MINSQLQMVPHLPVSIDTNHRNPLPTYHTTTSLKMSRIPLRTQLVALHPTGISPVPLQTIPTRPVEVQPISKVPLPGGGARLPYFAPGKRTSTRGRWGRIQIATQDPAREQGIHEEEIFDQQAVGEEPFEQLVPEEAAFEPQIAFAFEEGRALVEAEGEAGLEYESEPEAVTPAATDAASAIFESSDTTRHTPVLIREDVALPMHRVPLARMPRMRVGIAPVHTQTIAVRRSKSAPRPKKPMSARIW